ncbi:MAG: hypothetical protein RID53_21690 [Coleofasciculus sp. B1-GNL1-01]|uniref:hypothetical protein n=1 Tax=Coleofasciculus sp. B1-GNL1-01 TaxID=3068484 RepID=UPI0032F3C12E
MNINLPNKAVIGAVVIAGSTLLALGTSPLWGEKSTEASTLLSNQNAGIRANTNQEIAQSPPDTPRGRGRWGHGHGQGHGQGHPGRGRWGQGHGRGRQEHPGRRPRGLGNRMYNPDSVETITGEVISVDRFTSNRGRSEGMRMQMRTGNETVSVHLGPAWYWQNQGMTIEPNDRIQVQGSRVNRAGNPAMIAAQVQKGNQVLRLRNENGVPVWSRRQLPQN